MFALKIKLGKIITEGSADGKVVIESCNRVLLAKPNETDTVFEALICKRSNVGFEGTKRDTLYICLAQSAVEYFGLKNEMTLKLDMQFVLDRLPFCQMHYTLDALKEDEILARIVPEKLKSSVKPGRSKFDIRFVLCLCKFVYNLLKYN